MRQRVRDRDRIVKDTQRKGEIKKGTEVVEEEEEEDRAAPQFFEKKMLTPVSCTEHLSVSLLLFNFL